MTVTSLEDIQTPFSENKGFIGLDLNSPERKIHSGSVSNIIGNENQTNFETKSSNFSAKVT